MIILSYTLFILYIISLYKTEIKEVREFKLHTFNPTAIEPLKGLLALIVMFCHITQKSDLGIFDELGNYGAVAVDIFFFISGYGLFYSLLNKEDYLRHFLSKRFSKLLPPIVIVTVCFISIEILWQEKSFEDILNMLVRNKTLTPSAWFVYVIILYYFAFYVIFKVITRKIYALLVMSLFIAIYIIALKKLNWGAWWYMSSHCFPLGMIYCYFEEHIKKLFIGKKRLLIYFSAMCTILYCGIGTYLNWPAWGSIIYYFIPLLVMPLMYTLSFGESPFLRFSGKISYEIYIVHGVFINFSIDLFAPDITFVLFIITATYITSYGLHLLCANVNKKIFNK